MPLIFDERPSDSPYVECVWRTHSHEASMFTSVAATRWEMVIMTHRGHTSITMRGPETAATPATCPPDAEFVGILFKHGAYMPHVSPSDLVDHNDLTLPNAGSQSFWLQGAAWQFPTYENADTFVNRLMRGGLITHDEVVQAVLQGWPNDYSVRTVRRRFLNATGLTPGTLRQIERAHCAMNLLLQGLPILDTVFEAGYFDQPHLTRSLKRFIGQTPAQISEDAALSLMNIAQPA